MAQTAVKERGIIFTAWSIPKIIDRTKTQTRRTYGLEEINKDPDNWELLGERVGKGYWRFEHKERLEYKLIKCPYGQAGDRLWVRETWAGGIDKTPKSVDYKADGYDYGIDKLPWKSPRFMPRWASRIDLEITELRAERLQEISWRDIQAEGVTVKVKHAYDFDSGMRMPEENYHQWLRVGFRDLWDSLNPKYSFDFNPWVWPIGFKEV